MTIVEKDYEKCLKLKRFTIQNMPITLHSSLYLKSVIFGRLKNFLNTKSGNPFFMGLFLSNTVGFSPKFCQQIFKDFFSKILKICQKLRFGDFNADKREPYHIQTKFNSKFLQDRTKMLKNHVVTKRIASPYQYSNGK